MEIFSSMKKRIIGVLVVVIALTLVFGATSVQAQDATATPVYPSATVIVSALNIRSGPGTSNARIGTARSGDILAVSGKNGDCTWISITSEDGLEGWVSASERFVTIDTDCDEIAIVEGTETPTPTATPAIAATTTPVSTVAPSPTAAPEATLQPAPEEGNGVPEGKGCIDFGNWAGPDVIISGSLKDTNEVFDLIVKNNTVERICLNHGRWGVTISAIANFWRDLVLDIEVKPGEVIDFPLVGS